MPATENSQCGLGEVGDFVGLDGRADRVVGVPMSGLDQLRVLAPDAVELPGLGHNAHVEDPDALLPHLAHFVDEVR